LNRQHQQLPQCTKRLLRHLIDSISNCHGIDGINIHHRVESQQSLWYKWYQHIAVGLTASANAEVHIDGMNVQHGIDGISDSNKIDGIKIRQLHWQHL
jgi:hypothetical protein